MILHVADRSFWKIPAIGLLCLSGAAQAGTGRAALDSDNDRLLESLAQPIIVLATRLPTSLLGSPASVSFMDDAQLQQRNIGRLGDALADVPGLYIRGAAMGANFPGTGQAVISLRGIPRTPRTLVLLDGQPLNNALSGGVNVAGIPFESVNAVEVVRGPYSALYGGNAMGGAVNFLTAGPDDAITELRAGVGTLWQRSASLAYRNRFSNGLGVTLSLGWRASDGYGGSDVVLKRIAPGPVSGTPVSGGMATTTPDQLPRYLVGDVGAKPWWQGNGQLALHYTLDGGTKLTAGVGWAQYSVKYSRPETYLRDANGDPVFSGQVIVGDEVPQRLSLAETDFFAFTPSGERDWRLFVRADHEFDNGANVRLKLGTLRHRFRYTMPTSGVAQYDSGPGELTDQPNTRIDMDLSAHWPVAKGWSLTGGVAFNRATMDRKTRDLTSWRDWSSTGAIRTEGIGRASSLSAFLQSEHELGHGLSGYVGGRYDRFSTRGRVIDNGTPFFDETYDTRRFSQFSPKLALVWEANDWMSFRASYGRGFRPPALLDMYSRTVPPTVTAGLLSVILPAPDLKPERVSSWEAGVDFLTERGGTASISFYRQRLSDLIYRQSLTADGTRSRNTNAGAASVDGIEADFRLPTPVKGLKAFASLTHHFRAEITRNEASPATVGKRLTDVPKTNWSLGLEYDHKPWSAMVVARRTGHVFGSGNDLNTNVIQGIYGSYDAHTVVSARMARKIGDHLTLSLSGDNLLNKEYYVYARQPGRTVFGEASWRF